MEDIQLEKIANEMQRMREALERIDETLTNIDVGGIAVYLNDGEEGHINVKTNGEE